MRRATALAALSGLLGLAATPPSKPMELPDVVVKDSPKAGDETASHTVIDRREVGKPATALPEVLDEQPGLRASSLGGAGGFSSVTIRGSTGEQVNVYLDGVPLNAGVGGPVDVGSIPLGPVDRVVIYRGLSPLLFGASAMGGVINVHTRSPQDHVLELRAGGGSFGTRMGRLFWGGGCDDWSASLALDYQGSQGNFTFTNDAGTVFDANDDEEVTRTNNQFDSGTLLAKGKIALAEGLSLSAINFLYAKRHGVSGHGLHPTVASELTHLRNLVALNLEGRRVGGTPFRFSAIPWLTWSQLEFKDPLGEVGVGVDATRDRHISSGIRLHASLPVPLGSNMEWWVTPLATLELQHEIFTAGGKGVGSIQASDSTRTRVSAGTGVVWALEPIETEIVASVRHEETWSLLTTPENRDDLTREAPRNATRDALTWRVALAQRSIPDVKLTANFSKSVRMPSLFELFGNTGAVLGNPSLDPENGVNMDVGAIWNPSGVGDRNRVSLEIYGFFNQANDRIQFVRTSQGVSVAQNIASSDVFGVEVGAYADVLGHLRGRASASWMPTINRTPLPAYEGKQLPNRPRWKAYGRIEAYRAISFLGTGEFGLHMDVEALGQNYDDLANLIEFPERVLIGAGVYMTFLDEQCRLAIDAKNLTDASVQDFIGHPHPGFSLMVTMAWNPSSSNSAGDD